MNRTPLSFILLMLVVPYSFIRGMASPATEDSVDVWKRSALKVFLDCRRCDDDYIRNQITFINYVIDRQEAQLHLLITSQHTASGGREYTLYFIGQADFAGKNDTLLFNTYQDDTDDIIREKLVSIMKLGLVSYVSRTPMLSFTSVIRENWTVSFGERNSGEIPVISMMRSRDSSQKTGLIEGTSIRLLRVLSLLFLYFTSK